MQWLQVLELVGRVCAEQGAERRVVLVLPDAAFHVKEVLEAGGDDDLLGFVVYADDPDLSKRTAETSLLFVRPEQVQRLLVRGYDASSGGPLGFFA